MAKTNKITYTDTDRNIVRVLNALKNENPDKDAFTLAEVNELIVNENADAKAIAPASMTSAFNKGLIGKTDEKLPITRAGNYKVFTYRLVTADLQTKDGKALPYSDGEKAIIKALAEVDGFITLEDLATNMGVARILPGSVSGLIRKGNVEKCAEDDKVIVPALVKSSAFGYFAKVTEVPNTNNAE